MRCTWALFRTKRATEYNMLIHQFTIQCPSDTFRISYKESQVSSQFTPHYYRLQNSKPQFRSPNRIVLLERRPCIAKRCSSSPSTAHYMSVRKINEAPMTRKHQRAATCDETGPGLQATPPSARGRALSKHYGESARCRGALTRWHGEGEADGRSLHPDPGAPPQRHTPPVRTGSRRI